MVLSQLWGYYQWSFVFTVLTLQLWQHKKPLQTVEVLPSQETYMCRQHPSYPHKEPVQVTSIRNLSNFQVTHTRNLFKLPAQETCPISKLPTQKAVSKLPTQEAMYTCGCVFEIESHWQKCFHVHVPTH